MHDAFWQLAYFYNAIDLKKYKYAKYSEMNIDIIKSFRKKFPYDFYTPNVRFYDGENGYLKIRDSFFEKIGEYL